MQTVISIFQKKTFTYPKINAEIKSLKARLKNMNNITIKGLLHQRTILVMYSCFVFEM